MGFSARSREARPRFGLPLVGWLILLALGLMVGGPLATAEDDDGGGSDKAPTPEWANVKSGLHAQAISSLRIHPKAANIMYAHVHGMGAARSTDDGKTWEKIHTGVKPEPGPRSNVRITMDPTKPRWLYLVVDGQVYASQDAATTWSNITTGALASYSWDRKSTSNRLWEIRVDPGKSAHLVVGTFSDGLHHGGLYESTDGGDNWEQVAGSNLPRSGLGEAGHDTFWVRIDPKTEKNVLIAGREHVWMSEDRGRTFELSDPGGDGVHQIRGVAVSDSGKDIYVADARGIYRMKGFGKKWGKGPEVEGDVAGVFLSPTSKKRLYAVFHDRGVQVSSDSRHKKWTPLGGDDGYAAGEISEILLHPKTKGTIYFCSLATGLHVSTDDGKTIKAIEDSNIPVLTPGLVDIGAHPAEGNTHLALTEQGVVFQSTDNGASWSRIGRLGQVPHRVIADAREDKKGVWYATGRQLLRSDDDGATWSPIYTPDNPEERVVAVEQVTVDGTHVISIALERAGQILSTGDEGKTWAGSKPAPISKGTWITSFAINPADPKHMVVAGRTLRRIWSDKDMDGGVFQSLDGGNTWQDMSFNLKPGKKDSADERRRKANWNRGRFVGFDTQASLVLYGADGGGLWARAIPREGEDKGSVSLDWINITPTSMPDSAMGQIAHTIGGPRGSEWTIQLSKPGSDNVALAAICTATLRALYDAAVAPEKDEDDDEGDEKPAPGWTTLVAPGAVLDALHADPAMPGRLVGCDAEGDGVFLYQVGGARKTAGTDDEGDEEQPDGQPDGPRQYDPPTGMQAFSASADQDIKVWTVLDAKQETPLRGHGGAIFAVTLSNDEAMVASGGADRKVVLWQRPELKVAAEIPAPGEVNCLVFDEDAEKLYAGCASWQIVIIDKEQKKSLGLLEGHAGAVTALATSQDSAMLYSGSKDGKVKVWDVTQQTDVMTIDFGAEVNTVAVAPDGSRIYVGGANRMVKVYGADGTELKQWDSTQDAVVALALGSQGKKLFVGGVGGVDVLDTADMKPITRLVGPEREVLCLSVSVEGLWLFAGDADNGLWFWQTDTPDARWSNPGAHAGAVFSVAMTPDATEVDLAPPPQPANGGGEPDGDEEEGEGKPDGDTKKDGDAEK